MTAIANLPDLRPSLLLDFANSGRVDPRIQCARPSAATCFGPDGKLRTVAANVPRIDYDPATGKCLGLLVEEARTNFAKNSESTGAPAVWTLNTASGQGEMVDEGAHTRISCTQGVISVRFAIHVHDDLRTDKNVAFSVEVKAATGAKLVHIQRNGYVNSYLRSIYNFEDFSTASFVDGESICTEFGAKAMSDGWTRLSIAGSVRKTEISLGQEFALGEIRAGQSVLARRVQIEAGAFPTSYIPTEASAVTRAADIATVPAHQLSAFGTLLGKYSKAGWKHTSTPPVGALDLSKRIDSGAQVNDTIERLMLYPRQLTAAQITRLTA